ncbi:hypothetical protein BD408DRAFT_407165 [Parasitella parasitica]|nr:hypothetical protein BD408DRAFT_407165 [Parasitella parasitica]
MKRSVSITDECHGLLQLIFGISGAAPPSNLDEGLRAPTIAIPIQTCRNARVIVDNKCADIFARLIAKENMMIMLYNIISKHVQQYQKSSDQDNLTAAKNLCQMLETCIDNTENVNDIFDLRDYILTQRPETNDFHLPTLGSIELWNIPFERELLKVCNQITAVDDNYQAPQDLVLKLIKVGNHNYYGTHF